MKKSKLFAIDLCLIAMCVALMAIFSWISIPSTVPFTLQTFGIFITCALLGGKRGTIAVFIYILLGLIGVPVFSGFHGGLAYALGPTGGYIIGFLFTALSMWLFEIIIKNRLVSLIVGAVIGLLLCYLFGSIWFYYVYIGQGKEITFWKILMLCVIPYIIPDVIKGGLAIFLSYKLKRFIPTHSGNKSSDNNN